MIFFDLRALADAPQLHERVARVALVFGAHDLVVILLGDETELDELRIGQEIQRDQIGPRFLERGKLLFQRRLRIALQPLLDLARRVPDDLVHVRRQLAGERAPLLRPRGFFRRPGRTRCGTPAASTCRRPR